MDELFQKSPDQSLNQEDTSQVPEGELKAVRELLQSLLKTKRAFEMYPANNPILVKFQDDLSRRFEDIFKEIDKLSLLIRQQEILYKGQTVYKSTDKDESLALLFYKDGLRELSFMEGFSQEELMDFIEVIRAKPDAMSENWDDDIVTLLWEKDFVHLRYYVVEEFSDGEALSEEEVQKLLSMEHEEGNLTEVYKDTAESEEKEIFSPLESISMGFKGVFSLGEEEVKTLKDEIDGLTDEMFLDEAIYCLFESLFMERGSTDFELVVGSLESALSYLVHTGGFKTASHILRRFRSLTGGGDGFNQHEVERLKTAITRAGSETRTKIIAEVLNSGREINIDDFRQYLGQLDRASIIPLSNLMGEVQDIKYRKTLIDALVSLGKDNIEVLAAGLKSGQWYIVRNVAAILGRIGDKKALEYLKQAVKHPEPKVRREVVRALGMVGGAKAGEILLDVLDDSDPQIRMAALRYLPQAQNYSVLDVLVEAITRPDFDEKTLSEKRVFFEVLAEIGQEKVMPFMIKLLKRRGFLFGSAKNEETRVCAAYGLGNIRHKDSLRALESVSSHAKKGSALHDAVSYSVHKLSGPDGMGQEV
ncbi:MAG: HEAT repeat domain-containing protein [Nitrospirota bacterium]